MFCVLERDDETRIPGLSRDGVAGAIRVLQAIQWTSLPCLIIFVGDKNGSEGCECGSINKVGKPDVGA